MENQYRILVVEDDKEIREGILIYLKNQGYLVFQAENGLEGLKVIEQEENPSGNRGHHDAGDGPELPC